MSEPATSAELIRTPLQLYRLPVDKAGPAVAFLHARSQGVMDLIAHFWERLAQTPPLQRNDLHLIVAASNELSNEHIDIQNLDGRISGAMLYVPKAHCADVLALDPVTASAFCMYIRHRGVAAIRSDNGKTHSASTDTVEPAPAEKDGVLDDNTLSVLDLSSQVKGVAPASDLSSIASVPAITAEQIPIDFITGPSETIEWMVPVLLPLVHRKSPARRLVNSVMQLPENVPCASDSNVRLAKESDVPTLNRWRKQYREERGILFNADLDAWVDAGRVFVYEHDKQVVAIAKFDLELHRLIEIGGVYTFPEFRQQGFGGKIVSDLACRIREAGKIPTLQVDESNAPAMNLYHSAGWLPMGKLSRVWLTG